MATAHNPFWVYSLRLYKRSGVAPACLVLQDRAGIDVNLLLFCLWTGRRGLPLKTSAIAAAITVSANWADAVVRPLRAVRRNLKSPASSSVAVNNLRQSVARVELAAERVQQDRLYSLTRGIAPRRGEGIALAAANVATYFQRARIRLTRRDWTALATVIRAAFPPIRPAGTPSV